MTSSATVLAVAAKHHHYAGTLAVSAISGYPVWAAIVVAAAATVLWRRHWMPRVTSWLFFTAAGLATIGVTVFLDALAGLTATGTGITVLLVVTLIAGVTVYEHTRHRQRHHRTLSPPVFVAAGVAVALVIASYKAISLFAVHSVSGSGKALSQAVTQVQSGKAAAHAPHGHSSVTVLGIAVLIVIVMYVAMRKHDDPKSKFGGKPRAVTSGRTVGGGQNAPIQQANSAEMARRK